MSKKQKLAEMAAKINEMKAKLALVQESKKAAPKPSLATLIEGAVESVVESSEVIIAAKAITGKIRKMAEDVAKLQTVEVMNLVDPIKEHFGPQVADKFEQAAIAQLAALGEALRKAKDGVDAEITRMESIVNGGSGTDMEMDVEPAAPAADMPADDAPVTPEAPAAAPEASAEPVPEVPAEGGEMPELDLGDDEASPDDNGTIAALFKDDGTNPAGRPRKESAEPRGRALNEGEDEKGTYKLKVWCKPTGHVYAEEEFEGTQVAAEKKLGSLWNKHCAHMADRGNRATLTKKGQKKVCQTITDSVEYGAKALAEAADPDALVLKAFRFNLKEGAAPADAARATARHFDIDVEDVVEIVKENALADSDVVYSDRSIARDLVDTYVTRRGIKVLKWEDGKVRVQGTPSAIRELGAAIRMKELYPDTE